MTTEPPTTPHGWEQNNTNGGVGFQGGEHHHHYSGNTVGDPVPAATAAATTREAIGSPITDWDPLELGVHTSITTTGPGQHEGLPYYVARPHDQQLRNLLRGLVDQGESGLVVLVGDSCTGKTRSLYEAVTDPTVGLTTRPVYKPARPGQPVLADRLRAGLPGPVIVWLDELQRYLGQDELGANVAGALRILLTAPPAQVGGPIIVVATLWTTTLTALTTEPRTDAGGAAGADRVRTLLTTDHNHHVHQVAVAPDFTSAEPAQLRAAAAADHRVEAALQFAGDPARITQVLAGGTSLLARLYPDNPELQSAAAGAGPAFHPPARAVIYAAGELRRVGWGDAPIPHALLRRVATGYLDGPHLHGWFDRGVTEATSGAVDDHEHRLNIRTFGIPALTALEDPYGHPVYQLHDYLAQDHEHRHRHAPTRQSLWDALVDQLDTLEVPVEVAEAAAARGLYSPAIKLLHAHADRGTSLAQDLLAELLADRATQGDANAFSELQLQGAANRYAADRLVAVLADRAAHGDADALWQLKERAGSGESRAADRLAALLAERAAGGDAVALAELRSAGRRNRYTRDLLARVLADRATQGDGDALTELRSRVDGGDNGSFERRLAAVLASRADDGETDALTELRVRAHRGRWVFRLKLAELLAGWAAEGDQSALAELRTYAGDGFLPAEAQTAHVVLMPAAQGDEGDLAELRAREFGPAIPFGAIWLGACMAGSGGRSSRSLRAPDSRRNRRLDQPAATW